MAKILKIKVNDNLRSIFNYIESYQYKITWNDLVMFCLDYDLYKELYSNHFIINYMIIDHNKKAPEKEEKEEEE